MKSFTSATCLSFLHLSRSLKRRSSDKRTSPSTSAAWRRSARSGKKKCAAINADRTRAIAVETEAVTDADARCHVIVDITGVKIAQFPQENFLSLPLPAPPSNPNFHVNIQTRRKFSRSGKRFFLSLEFSKFFHVSSQSSTELFSPIQKDFLQHLIN